MKITKFHFLYMASKSGWGNKEKPSLIGDRLSLVSPFARCLSFIILFPVFGIPFNSLPFLQRTVSVFQQLFWRVFLSGESYFVVQKLSLLAPSDSSLHRRSSPLFSRAIRATTCNHLLWPSLLIFSHFVKSAPLRCNLSAPTTTMVLVFLRFCFCCSFFSIPLLSLHH